MITAVVPMKPLKEAKRRLSAVLDEDTRRRLAALMLGDVLACLARSPSIDEVLVVSADDGVAEIAAGHGARLLREPCARGLDPAVAFAAERLTGRGVQSMLFLPGDVPLVTAEEIAAMTGAARNATAVVVPSHDREGTNAMLLTPPGVISPAFGPGSFGRHMSAAKRAGVTAAVLHLAGVSRDIDNGADVLRLAAARARDGRYGFLVKCVKSLLREAV